MTNKDKSLEEIIENLVFAIRTDTQRIGVSSEINEASAQINNYIKEQMLSLIEERYEMGITDIELIQRREGVEVPVLSKTALIKAINERFK